MTTFTGNTFQNSAYPTALDCAIASVVEFVTAGGLNDEDEAIAHMAVASTGYGLAVMMTEFGATPHALVLEDWPAVQAGALREIRGEASE